MRIAIDARLIAYRRGIGNIVYHLTHELAKLETGHEFIAYVDSQAAVAALPKCAEWRAHNLGRFPYPVWEQILLPIAIRRDRPRVLHAPANTGPLLLPNRTQLVLTINDVMYLLAERDLPTTPSLYHRAGRWYRRTIVPRVALRAAKVTTISQHSRDDIARVLGLAPADVAVVYPAPNSACQPMKVEDTRATLGTRGIRGPFILALAALDPRKNTSRIIEAFARFRARVPEPYQLVLVGLSPGGEARFRSEAERLGVQREVIAAGFVAEHELAALYNAASMFAYPSLYEGFGLPVLEAMACRTPVIASPNGSLREISGDAALLVDPFDIGSLADAFVRVATDEDVRRDLVTRGEARARQFSWRRAARQMLDVYEAAAS